MTVKRADDCGEEKQFLWGRAVCGEKKGHKGLHITWSGRHSWSQTAAFVNKVKRPGPASR